MSERLPLNNSPLNQLCKSLLPKEEADQGYLYSLQLVIWGLENLTLNDQNLQADLLDEAYLALSWKPIKAQELVMNPEYQDDLMSQMMTKHGALESLNREDAALNLIEEFHSQMKRRKSKFDTTTDD